MIPLYVALYSEGSTDNRFLSTLIERTSQQIVLERQAELIDVQNILTISREDVRSGANRAEKLRLAARIASEYEILIVHNDADTQTHDEVLVTSFDSGRLLIEQELHSERLCRNLVPLIPDRMIEA